MVLPLLERINHITKDGSFLDLDRKAIEKSELAMPNRRRTTLTGDGGKGAQDGEGGKGRNIAPRLPSKYRGEVIAGSAARKPRH